MVTAKSKVKDIIVYEVEHVFGRKIVSSGDCIQLGDEIFKKTNHQINPNTLRRFFGLVKADYPPAQSTLMILAKYCGFESLEDIYKIKNTDTIENGTINPDTVLHFFVSVFKESVVIEPNNPLFINMVIETIKFLNVNKFLTDKFQSLISKTTSGNNYYFEQLVNVDSLNSFYGNGLRYYVKEKGTQEAEVFTASLYVFKYWLSGEDEKLVKSSAKVLAYTSSANLHPCMLARQYAAILFYHDVTKTDSEITRIKIHNSYFDLTTSATNNKFLNHYIYIVSEALMLTGYPEDALFYLKQIKVRDEDSENNYDPFNYSQVYSLTEAYALYNLGKIKQAESKVKEIKSSEFPYLNKKFSGILYLSLLKKFTPVNKSIRYKEQMISWVEETGFKRLLTI